MAKVIICLVLITSFILAQCHNVVKRDTQVINEALDEIIQETKSVIVAGGQDQISIPDMDASFKKKWHFVHVSGSFKGTGGWFRSLSSIQRTGDTTFTTNGNRVTLDLRLGLGNMEIGFDHYKARFMHVGPSGKLNARVKHNSVYCQITLTYNGDECVASLDRANLDQFSGLEIHVTGLGPLNWIFSKIASWVTNHFHSKIKGKVENRLQSALVTALSKKNICKNIPH